MHSDPGAADIVQLTASSASANGLWFLPEDTDAKMLAAYYSAVARGLAVQARDGASRNKLVEIGRLAMRAWPVDSSAARKN